MERRQLVTAEAVSGLCHTGLGTARRSLRSRQLHSHLLRVVLVHRKGVATLAAPE